MYDWLEYLAGQSYTFGALGIAEVVLFLWKEHFETNPLYEQVTTLLLFRGSEQQGWFPTADHKLPIEEELSQLPIDSCKFPGCMTLALNSPKIFEVNKEAIECVSSALSMLGDERELNIYSSAACDKIAVLIDTQNSLVDEHIRTSVLTQLSRALRIQRLATQCTILSKIIKCENYRLDKPKENKYEDLTLLRASLQQLIST
jgi:hypothetical protein